MLLTSNTTYLTNIIVPNICLLLSLESTNHKLIIWCETVPNDILLAFNVEFFVKLVINNIPDEYFALWMS